MNRRGCWSGKLVGVRQAVSGLVDEGPVGKSEFGGAASDGPSRGAPGECLEDGAHLRRRCQSRLLNGGRRHKHPRGGAPVLPQTFVVQEKEDFVLNNRATQTTSVLSGAKRGRKRVSIDVEVIEVPRIENGIP